MYKDTKKHNGNTENAQTIDKLRLFTERENCQKQFNFHLFS